MKKLTQFSIIVLLASISLLYSFEEKKKTYTLSNKELLEFLQGYTDQFGIEFFPSDRVVIFRGKEIKSYLSSQALWDRSFEKNHPGSHGMNASFANYLMSMGFVVIKECAESDRGRGVTQIAFTWGKDNIAIHYILYSIYEHPSVGNEVRLSFFHEDVCGEDYRRAPGE